MEIRSDVKLFFEILTEADQLFFMVLNDGVFSQSKIVIGGKLWKEIDITGGDTADGRMRRRFFLKRVDGIKMMVNIADIISPRA